MDEQDEQDEFGTHSNIPFIPFIHVSDSQSCLTVPEAGSARVAFVTIALS